MRLRHWDRSPPLAVSLMRAITGQTYTISLVEGHGDYSGSWGQSHSLIRSDSLRSLSEDIGLLLIDDHVRGGRSVVSTTDRNGSGLMPI